MSYGGNQIRFVNHAGGGFAGTETAQQGETLGQFFSRKMGNHSDPNQFTIQVNSLSVEPNYVLQSGDCISITPAKVPGA